MRSARLHVVQISFFSDPAGRLPAQLLESWPSLVDVANAACRAGIDVSVLQASSHAERMERDGVRYYFLPFGDALPEIRPSAAFGDLLRHLAPHVLHVHGLGFLKDTLALAALAPGIPIAIQDHANRPPRFWRRASWRRGLKVASGLVFCAMQQAQPFVHAGLVDARTRLYAIPESTSRFTPGNQTAARRRTQITGNPALLWVGNLDANKDLLTVLDGISAAARSLPGVRLYCCFAIAPLLRAVHERIAADPLLRERVELLGQVPHARIEQLMRAADLFVLGSHREGSGFSLIEALACGLAPVVTDIPSFRALTGNGAVGRLWPCNDAPAFAAALRSMAARSGKEVRVAVRAHFDRELSFAALGVKLAAMYCELHEASGGVATSTLPAARALSV